MNRARFVVPVVFMFLAVLAFSAYAVGPSEVERVKGKIVELDKAAMKIKIDQKEYELEEGVLSEEIKVGDTVQALVVEDVVRKLTKISPTTP